VTKYRTIVADPPWRYKGTLPAPPHRYERGGGRSEIPYGTMTVEEIAALPVAEWAEKDAHLYLWTTNTHIAHAWKIAKAWGFEYSTLLTWCKAPRGLIGGATFTICTEHVLFCRRGTLKATERLQRNWWEWSRTPHSAKPEAFLDIVEQVSPGPYLEMFARRARFGWDYWGNESLGTAEVAA
jgi:N6-adenosine-specific RNA methylase IME4